MTSMAKRNPAADPRAMRRVIAEDPDWNLETVPPLVDTCISHIVKNFHARPLLDELMPSHREKVLKHLSPSVPLSVTAPLINDEGYWERCCRSRWELCNVSEHNHCWKTMFFERNAQEAVEKFVPGESDIAQLEELLRLSSDFIKCLIIRQLLPPPQEKPLVIEQEPEDADDMTENLSVKPCNDHLDCSIILRSLSKLEKLQLTYGSE